MDYGHSSKEEKIPTENIISFLKHLASQHTTTARLLTIWWVTITLLPIILLAGIVIGLVDLDPAFKLVDKCIEWILKIRHA